MPTIDVGGVEKNFLLISKYLGKKLNKLSVITTSYEKKALFRKNIEFISYSKFNTRFFSRRIKFFLALLLLFSELLKKKNNVVFAFQANFYCVFLCKIFKTRIIVRSNSSPTGWSHNFFKVKLYKYALKLADVIIVNSEQFKKLLSNKFKVNSICIYNPLNKKEIIKKSKQKINLSFFSNKTINFINVGRLEDQKDHETLINGFIKLKSEINYKLLIIGNGRNKNKLNILIKRNSLDNRIKIVDFKKNPYPFMKKADAFILSSIFEGLPNVLLEALVLKKFIISSNCPTGPLEILQNGKGGLLFKSKNSQDLKKKIIFFSKNKKKCFKKLTHATKSLDRFDYSINMKKYFNVIIRNLH